MSAYFNRLAGQLRSDGRATRAPSGSAGSSLEVIQEVVDAARPVAGLSELPAPPRARERSAGVMPSPALVDAAARPVMESESPFATVEVVTPPMQQRGEKSVGDQSRVREDGPTRRTMPTDRVVRVPPVRSEAEYIEAPAPLAASTPDLDVVEVFVGDVAPNQPVVTSPAAAVATAVDSPSRRSRASAVAASARRVATESPPAPRPTVEVHIGSIALEVHAPETSVAPAPAAPPAARSEAPPPRAPSPALTTRFSPSRHYLRRG